MQVPTRNSILASVLSELGPQQHTVDQHSSKDPGHKATSVNETPLQNQAKLQQREREEPTNIQEDSEGEDGIYDVPSSVLRSIHETVTDEPSDYNMLIPVSTHSAKVADGSQPKHPGWGYAEIKDVVPTSPGPTSATVPPNQNHTHSTNRSRGHYAKISDLVLSKDVKSVKPVSNDEDTSLEDTPDVKLTSNTPDDGNLTHDNGSSEDHQKKKSTTDLTAQSTVTNRETEYTENSDNEDDAHGIYDVPSSIIRSIHDVMAQEPSPQMSTITGETERSSETSDLEEARNVDTPEGSEGSDVFMDQLTVMPTTIQGRASTLPLLRHQSFAGAGCATLHQMGATMATHSPGTSRARFASESQASPKPRPAKRTKFTQPQDQLPTQHLPDKMLSQLAEDLQEKPPSKELPDEPPPPPRPEKPAPALPEKPAPALPEKPAPPLPEKPLPPNEPSVALSPPPLPEKPLPVLPNELPPPRPEKPPPTVFEKPPPVLPEKPLPPQPDEPTYTEELPALPDKPPLERTTPVQMKKSTEHHESQSAKPVFGRSPPQTSNRSPAPRPKPRRYVPASKQEAESGGNSQIEVRSGRSHTSASCSAAITTSVLASSSTPPTHQRHTANDEGSPKLYRSARAKSSSGTERNTTAINGQSPPHSPESTVQTVRAKAAAPPVARKPKPVSPNVSPLPVFNRREQLKPPTSPKPRRH